MKLYGIKRRIIYILFYEIIAILITTFGISWIFNKTLDQSGLLAMVTSIVAMTWNATFNSIFEFFEFKLKLKKRSLLNRTLHAFGYEIGLAIIMLPIISYILDISLLIALITNIGILVFFMGYVFIYNFCFDLIFGLPNSIKGDS
jgi:uncharacterized membrane protein